MFTQLEMYLVGALLLLVVSLGYGVYHYHGVWEKGKTDYAVLDSKNTELVDKIKADAIALDKYVADSGKRENDAKLAQAAAQNKANFFSKKAQDLLTAIPVNADACRSADFLFNNFIGDK